jgi:predicted dehydrogenase
MSRTAALPVAVVGVGSLGFHHARLLREVAGAEMVGIFDARAERAEEVATQLGVRAFGSLDELLSQVEAAVVAVPTTEHAEVALQAIDRGVSLLIEKPIAPPSRRPTGSWTRRSAAGVMVATGHVERFNARCGPASRICTTRLHRVAPAGALRPARHRRGRGAGPDDPRHRPGAGLVDPRSHGWTPSASRC